MDTSAQIDQELVHSGFAFQMGFRAIGPSNISIYPEAGQEVVLVPEPGNPFDQHAIALHNQDGFFGYINPEQNQGLSKYLESKNNYYASIRMCAELNQTHSMKYIITVYATDLIEQCHEVLRVPTRG